MSRSLRVFVLLCWSALLLAAPLPRKILGLYQNSGDRDAFYSMLHQHATFPLNHLGMDVVLRASNAPLPPREQLSDYHGIVTWFTSTDAIADPSAYCAWLQSALRAGKRVAMLGDPGFVPRDSNAPLPGSCHAVLRLLGVDYRGAATANPFFFSLEVPDPDRVEFERKLLQTEDLPYLWLAPRTGADAPQIWVAATRRDLPDSRSALVFVNRVGGVAYTGYALYHQANLDRKQWRIDPFRFFRDALGLHGRPTPDVTTAYGRRIFFSHIDGDGMFNHPRHSSDDYAGQVILREIIQRYADLPITVSIIAGYLDLPAYANAATRALYRALFEAPNVEVGAHGYAHPLVWAKRTLALDIPNYHYDATKEIAGAVSLTNNLLKDLQIPKHVAVYQWTGDCVPNDDETAIAEQLGIPHINGGDSRFDHYRNSYAYVAPVGINRGAARQIYTGAPNENIYTNLWKGPFYGYLDVLDTFARTESPIRVKPLNVYYHFFSGERYESLAAVQRAYDAALAQHPFPMFASRYARWARDAMTARLESDNGGYWIRNAGAMRTVRFELADIAPNAHVDLTASRGVLGFTVAHGSLYVALDDALEHFVRLTPQPPHEPYLIDASVDVARDDAWHWRLHGLGAPQWRFGGLRPGARYRVTFGTQSQEITATAAGELAGDAPIGAAATDATLHIIPL